MFLKRFKQINFQSFTWCAKKCLSMTTEDATVALRPFYFSVHPDFFVQHPSKREVNENSLKQLNSFIDSLRNNRQPQEPSTLKFYLRQSGKDGSKDIEFQAIDVTLNPQSLTETIQGILSTCNISEPAFEEEALDLLLEDESKVNKCPFYRKVPVINLDTLKNHRGRVTRIDLSWWLKKKTLVAESLTRGSRNAYGDTAQWCRLFKEKLSLKEVVWDTDAGPLKHRKCCEDLSKFLKHYPTEMLALKGLTLVFGLETGIHLNGDIYFGYTSHQRHLWLQVLRTLSEKYETLKKIRKCERTLSSLLGLQIVHTNSRPMLCFNKHLYLLDKLTESMTCYLQDHPLTESSTERLQDLKLEFDGESSELALLESGEMVLPFCYTTKDLVNFILDKSSSAKDAIEYNSRQLWLEKEIQDKCLRALNLGSLSKDENLSSEKMIFTCQRLMVHQATLKRLLQGAHVCITDYYVILEEGVMCFPWDWKDKLLD